QHATDYKFKSTNDKLSSSLNRCQNPIRPNSYYAPDAFFDFCIRPLKDIAGVGSGGSNTVVAEKMAEVQIRLYDIHSMKPLSCSEYMNKRNNSLDKTASAFLWIRLFWEAKADGQLKVFSRDLNFIFGSI
ncbi:MAG: hypothetical protein NTX25_01955, partial [Proteobacteria bacterium]|nr:hypothetical protein [Pseudomonadota bacterium]